MARSVRNLPAAQETRVQSLSQEDLLGQEMATHSSILAWEIPWTEKAHNTYDSYLNKILENASSSVDP